MITAVFAAVRHEDHGHYLYQNPGNWCVPVLRADGNAMRHCNRSSDIAPARSKELEASP